MKQKFILIYLPYCRNSMRLYPIIILMLSIVNIACTPKVAAWERGILAKPHMLLQSNSLENSVRQHMHSSKEASAGGRNAGGGGCGCG